VKVLCKNKTITLIDNWQIHASTISFNSSRTPSTRLVGRTTRIEELVHKRQAAVENDTVRIRRLNPVAQVLMHSALYQFAVQIHPIYLLPDGSGR